MVRHDLHHRDHLAEVAVRDELDTPKLLSLDDQAATDPPRSGTKAGALAVLRSAGFAVPDGWVLPVGIASWCQQPGARAALTDLVELACTKAGGPVAVRSSTTWEDGITSAHAGETVVRIGAASGLGDAFVSGEVTGIDVTVRRTAAGDLIEGDTAGISEDVLHDVARLARGVDDHQRMPQDIEWAYHAGVVHLVQARPITVLPVRPSLPEGKGWDKDVAHCPEPVTPFGFSAEQSTASAVAEVFSDLGMLVKGLEARLVGGEFYSRPVPAFGPPGDAAPPPAWVLGALSRVLPPLRKLNKKARAAVDDNLYSRWIEQYEQVERMSYPARSAALRTVNLAEMSDRDLADHAAKLVEHACVGMRVHFRIGLAVFDALYTLHQLVGTALEWDDAAIATMLIGHSPATRASEAALADLRARLRASEAATVALTERPSQPVAAIANVNPALAADVERWVDEHGWGCVNYDAGAPVLAERPALVTRLLLSDPDVPESRCLPTSATPSSQH